MARQLLLLFADQDTVSAQRSPSLNAHTLFFLRLQAVEMFLDEKVGYMDIVKLVEQCCDAHRRELVMAPSLDEIVHYDAWARQWVAQRAGKEQPLAVA